MLQNKKKLLFNVFRCLLKNWQNNNNNNKMLERKRKNCYIFINRERREMKILLIATKEFLCFLFYIFLLIYTVCSRMSF
jgi:hypothetical protein